jgi:hypothetical protein
VNAHVRVKLGTQVLVGPHAYRMHFQVRHLVGRGAGDLALAEERVGLAGYWEAFDRIAVDSEFGCLKGQNYLC